MAIQSQTHRRRRRRRSSARPTAQPVQYSRGQRQIRIRSAEVFASIAVVVAAAALIALIWINADRAIQAEIIETSGRAEATVSGQAAVLADEVRRELIGIDQTLRIVKHAFETDPEHFDIRSMREQLPLLMEPSEDLFIADDKGVIQQDTIPQAVGMGIASQGYSSFNPGELETIKENTLLIGPTAISLPSRQYLAYVMMRMDKPPGWMIGASYRTDTFTRLFAEASLGVQGMTALINTRQGRIQAVAGPAAAVPGYDIAKSAMYEALTTRNDSTWIGPSAPDNVERIHGFRRVPGRDLTVVVAVDRAQAMQPATQWAEGVRVLASGATLVVLLLMATCLREVWMFRAGRRRRQALERERAIVANTQVELAEVRARANTRAAQLQALLASIGEGVATVDPELRLTEWNAAFAARGGIAPEVLQPGLPLDELLRTQAKAGLFGTLDDVEAEVSRRLALLQTAGAVAPLTPPGGEPTTAASHKFADGSLLIVLAKPGEGPPVAAPASTEPAAGPIETL